MSDFNGTAAGTAYRVQEDESSNKRSRPPLRILTHSASSSISSTSSSSASETEGSAAAPGAQDVFVVTPDTYSAEPENTSNGLSDDAHLVHTGRQNSMSDLPKLSKLLISNNPMLGNRAKELQEKITKLRRHTSSYSKLD